MMKSKAITNGEIPEEDMEDQRKKAHLLKGAKKAFYHTYVLAKQKNKEMIKQLQNENKELRDQLKARAVSTGIGSADPNASENLSSKTEKELALWRRKWDNAISVTKKKKSDLLALQDKLGELH